jgi:hypothetical protein
MAAIKVFTPNCLECGEGSVVEVDPWQYKAWRDGTLIQVAFPDMSIADRELLISGTHPECWDKMVTNEEAW